MRAWDETDDLLRRAAERRDADHEETLRDLDAEGVALDPPPPGQHRHGDDDHPSDHEHPHVHSAPGERPVVGIVGAGAVGMALGIALDRAGWPVGAVASRDPGRRQRFRDRVTSARGFAEANALVDDVELVILAIPDDAIVAVAESIRLYAGQALVHTSGVLGADALRPALAAGTQAGAFHPLVAFADLDRALAALPGATVAIEGDDELAAHLAEMAESIGAVPVRLPAGIEGGLPRGGRARGRRRRRAARHDPRDRRPARARRGGGDGHLPAARRADRWATPRRSASPGRSRVPRHAATSGRSRRTSRRSGRAPPTRSRSTGRSSRATPGSPLSVAHCHQSLQNVSGPHLQATRDAVGCGHAAQHRRALRGMAGALRPPHGTSPRASPGPEPGIGVHRGARSPDGPRIAPTSARLTALRAPWRALTIEPVRASASGRPAPASRMRWTSSTRAGGSRRSSVAPAWPA